MHWFIDPIKNHYADFNGRVGRQEFWMFILFSFLLNVALEIVDVEVLAMVVWLALIVPNIALTSRRLHDTGKSGWWQLLWLIPVVGWIILIVWLATKTDAANMFGNPAVPKTGPEGTPIGAGPTETPVATSHEAIPTQTAEPTPVPDQSTTTTDTNGEHRP